jgi:predicted AAA+ superfamily ATPase
MKAMSENTRKDWIRRKSSIPTVLFLLSLQRKKKFQYSKVAKGARSKDYAGCIEWLSDAGLVNICYCLGFPELPLKGNIDTGKFKVYFSDTGLC